MKHNEKLRSLTQTAMLTAIIAALSQIAIPMPSSVPLTLQTFAVAVAAYLGGMRKGVPAVLLYIALGTVGVPVFSGFQGGMGKLLGLTGGFLWGFILLALLCGLGMLLRWKPGAVIMGMVGLLLCHFCGVLQYAVLSGMGFAESLFLVSVPYLLKDAISACAAYAAAEAVQHALRRAGLHEI